VYLTHYSMKSLTLAVFGLLECAIAFQAPAFKASNRAVGVSMFTEGDIGVLPPLGVYDPLGLSKTEDMRRWEIAEIKHGRAAMLGFVHVVLIHAGFRFGGYLSFSENIKFSDVPTGCLASLQTIPFFGWLQIIAFIGFSETGYLPVASGIVKQADDKAPGDIGGASWVRYSDPAVKKYKLNIERSNGRLAMVGMAGCIVHELLGVDALYPTGGYDGAAPPPVCSLIGQVCY